MGIPVSRPGRETACEGYSLVLSAIYSGLAVSGGMRWLSGANATCPRDLQYGDPTTAGTDDDNSRVCTVSGSSVDAVFVSAASVLLFAVFSRRLLLSAVWLFLIGFSAAAIVYGFFDNTSRLSNGFSLWLNASTGDMLVYVFLPGLLLYESLRMDFHQFKTYLVQSIVFSFLVALGSTALLCVVMLWALDLGSQGWTNAHAGLFGAILASTDAASVVSRIMKSSLVGAPEHLTYMLRGESLFNNGISMVLFNIFLGHVNAIYSGNEPLPVPELLGEVAKDLVIASSSGIALGFFFAVAYHLFGGFLKRCPCIREGEDDLTTLTLAVAYVCFYVAQAPATSSGPIAVVVFGLYGAWTGKYGLSGSYLQVCPIWGCSGPCKAHNDMARPSNQSVPMH